MIQYYLKVLLVIVVIGGCEKTQTENTQIQKKPLNTAVKQARWYSPSQIVTGGDLFKENCAICHGDNAQGTTNWRRKLVDGSYPPPPLNGSAHTWHHPMVLLEQIIDNGGLRWGGKMPGFKDKLSIPEKHAIIAFFQDKWPDKIYQAWSEINTQSLEAVR